MNVESCDCFSQIVFEDVDRFVAMTEDPYYKQYISKDPPNFADQKNTKYVGLLPFSFGIGSYPPSYSWIWKFCLHGARLL